MAWREMVGYGIEIPVEVVLLKRVRFLPGWVN